jgi:hypothetical protein
MDDKLINVGKYKDKFNQLLGINNVDNSCFA